MTTSRREFIAGTGAALAALSGLTACAKRDTAITAADPLAGIADEMLADYPENATGLGIDTGPRAALKARLTDRSADGQQAIAKRVAERLARLKSVDASRLEDAARVDLDVVRTAHETATEGFAFPYGDVALLNSNWSWRNAPYVVAQNTGAFLEIPSLLEEQHTLDDPRGCRGLSRAPHGLRRPDRRRNRAPEGCGGAGRHRARFHPRQDARTAQARARRERRRLAFHRIIREEDEGHRRASSPPRPRRSRPTRSARRSNASTRSWRRTASRRPRTPAPGSCRRAMPTTPGRCVPRPRRA